MKFQKRRGIMTSETQRSVAIRSADATLEGNLSVPPGAHSLVIFAHGTGSSRFSPRNIFVARTLQEVGIATLLFDLLEEKEAEDRHKVFDVELLADRLVAATNWAKSDEETKNLHIGYFGASTGAAAALVAASRLQEAVKAVVSRGGRPDLAGGYLPDVRTPTLLIVGSHDLPVIPLNREAYEQLTCVKELVIVPGAGHLFEEPGALEQVARLARDWFLKYLK